jgi:hypothetical protein
MLRIPRCIENRLTGGAEVVSVTFWPFSTTQEHFLSASGTHYCFWLSKLQGLVRLEGLCKLKKFNDLIGSQIRNLPACSMLPRPTTMPRDIIPSLKSRLLNPRGGIIHNSEKGQIAPGIRSRKLRLTTVRDPPRWPRDSPLSAKVGIKFRQQVAVAQSIQFACGLKATECVFAPGLNYSRKTYGKITCGSIILDTGTSCTWAVSFTFLPLYPWG